MQTTEDIVAEIIADQLGVDKKLITPEKRLADELGVDVLDAVEIVMRIEDKYEMHVPEDDAEKFRTVGDIVEFLKSRGL